MRFRPLVLLLFLLPLLLPRHLPHGETRFSAEVLRVIDGDTMEVRILESNGWPEVGRVEKLRLAGVDAFELSEARGVLAKAFVDSLCPPGQRIHGRGKRARDPYGRLLAHVYLQAEGGWINLGEELLRRKLARKWD